MPDNTAPTTAAGLTGVFFGAEMTPTETAALLRQLNEWRRGADIDPPGPLAVGEAIDAAIAMIERLEAAEKSDAESIAMYRKARDERDTLRAKIETAENDAAHQKALAASALRVAKGWEDKCGELRAALRHEADCVNAAKAKIEAMERKVPICRAEDLRHAEILLPSLGLMPEDKLYALPGAQPAPSVPEDVMRDAERYRYLRARDDETAGIGCWIEAEGRACDRGWLYGVQLDSAIDTCIEMLAAAPEAKP